MNHLKILVIGPGAIGTYYGGRLSQAGAEVSVVARSEYHLLQKEPYHIKSIVGDFDFQPYSVFASTEDAGNNFDLILVSLKVLPKINRIKLLRPVVGAHTSILLLQNGIDIEEEIAQAFPNNEILTGLAFICVFRTAPGYVTHQDYGHVEIAPYPSGHSKILSRISDKFKKVGVECKMSQDAWESRWKKLNWNAPYNPMSVLCGNADTETMMHDSETLNIIRNVMQEVQCLSVKHGHGYPESFIDSQLETTRKMKAYKPSMLLDYEAGRQMEVEAILGNAVRIARRLDASTPHMDTLYALLKLANRKK